MEILVESCYQDPRLLKLYDAGDRLSRSQTKHDANHAYLVRDVAVELVRQLREHKCPEPLDEETASVVIPLAAFLHDIGRGVDVEDHAGAGARLMHKYLRDSGFPEHIVKRVCRIIACHRSKVVLSRELDDPAWAIVVIADKAVGDEDRVRPLRAKLLRIMRFFGAARLWQGEHDRVNFAIKEAHLVVDGDDRSLDPGAIVLKLRIDEKVARPDEIYSLYGERFHACGRAAQYLGYLFRLEFNGIRFVYDKAVSGWVPVKAIKVLEQV